MTEVFLRLHVHQVAEASEQHVQIFDDPAHILVLERQRLVQLLQHAHEVHDQAARLGVAGFVLVGPVDARDRLEQHVVPHRLVKIHAVENRRVEPGEQLVGNDEHPRVFVRTKEKFAGLLLGGFGELELSHKGAVDDVRGTRRIDRHRPLWRQMLVQLPLVEGTRLPVHRDHERFVAEGEDVFSEMLGNESGGVRDPRVGLEESPERHGVFKDTIQLLDVRDAFCFLERKKLSFEEIRRYDQLPRRRRMAQLNRGPVFDRLLDGVFVQVPLGILGAERLERALAVRRLVDGRSGETDQRTVGERARQVVAEVAAGRAVRFIDHDEDVGPRARVLPQALELVNHRDDEPAEVAIEQVL